MKLCDEHGEQYGGWLGRQDRKVSLDYLGCFTGNVDAVYNLSQGVPYSLSCVARRFHRATNIAITMV